MYGCITHHDACTCREEYFKATVQEWRDKVTALELQIDSLQKQLLADFVDKMPEDSVLVKRDKWKETERLNRELEEEHKGHISMIEEAAQMIDGLKKKLMVIVQENPAVTLIDRRVVEITDFSKLELVEEQWQGSFFILKVVEKR